MRAHLKPVLFAVGDEVRLRPGAPFARYHPALAGAVGIVGAIVHGPQWRRLGSSPFERAADLAAHIRFKAPHNIVVLNVEAEQIEHA